MNVLSIVITIIVIILIVIIIRMIWKRNNLVSVMPADTQQVVEASSLGNASGTTNNCTYSIWIYVNDWSVNYGEEKIIFQRSTSLTDPTDLIVSLGPYESTLSITTNLIEDPVYTKYMNEYRCNPLSGAAANFSCVGAKSSCEVECNNNDLCLGYQYDSYKGGFGNTGNCLMLNLNSPNTLPNYNIEQMPNTKNEIYYQEKQVSKHTCLVPNIEIQKWVNITFSASTYNIDIYIDGKLIQSCDLAGELNISNMTNVYISPNGKGFNGWNSRFRFLPKYINPNQAMAIYRQGHGSSNIGTLDYSLKVSLTNGSQQIGSVNI